jgi:hypothetical protein
MLFLSGGEHMQERFIVFKRRVEDKVENLFPQKPIEVKIPKNVWDEMHVRFSDAVLDQDPANRPYHLNRMHSIFEKAGLKQYYTVEFDDKRSMYGPKAEYEEISRNLTKDQAFMVLSFKKVKEPMHH